MIPVERYRGSPAVADTSLLCNRYSVVRRQRISRERKRGREGGKVEVRDDIYIGINIIIRKTVQLQLAALRNAPRHYVAK